MAEQAKRSRFKKYMMLFVVGALVGFAFMDWFFPSFLIWYVTPIEGQVFTCRNEVTLVLRVMVLAQLIGAAVMALIFVLVGALLSRRKHVPASQAS